MRYCALAPASGQVRAGPAVRSLPARAVVVKPANKMKAVNLTGAKVKKGRMNISLCHNACSSRAHLRLGSDAAKARNCGTNSGGQRVGQEMPLLLLLLWL